MEVLCHIQISVTDISSIEIVVGSNFRQSTFKLWMNMLYLYVDETP